MDYYYPNVEQALLALIRKSLFNEPLDDMQKINWDELYQEANAQTITALIADCVPEDPTGRWKMAYTKNLGKNVRYLHEQSELIDIFQNNNIPLAILKGSAAAVYYPIPMNRAMGDIDFIVPQNLYDDACNLMVKNGYTLKEDNPAESRHKRFAKRKFFYELHHHFSYDDLDIEKYVIDGLQHVDHQKMSGIEFPMLPKLANGLVLLSHLRSHLKKGLGLRQVIDWMMYVDKELDNSFWENEFHEAASKARMDKLAVTVTRMCQMYLGLSDSITWCRNADKGLCTYLMKDLLSYGNFGKKHGNGIVYEKTSATIRRMGLFRYLQAAGEEKFVLYHHHKWLKPFCWIYQIFYILGKSLKMRRGTRVLFDLEQSSKKNDLLKKLDIL